MNVAEFRKKFAPLAQSLKSESDRLRAAYSEVHERYMTLSNQIRALNEGPPHRSELETLLREGLDHAGATVHNEKFAHLVASWKGSDLLNRPDRARWFKKEFAEAPDGLLALVSVLIRDRLPEIVSALQWPDAPTPAERERRLQALATELEGVTAEMATLQAAAAEANIKLRD